MMEVSVAQRSKEWSELRQQMQLTASKFGDALGVGKGRPYDFFLSLLSQDADQENEQSEYTKHGTAMEPIIAEAYQLLTGYTPHTTGFWLPREGNILHGLCGASPDGKILAKNEPKNLLGLVEYKAPIHRLYDPSKHPHGIPRQYMAQIQGQMAICMARWCDFVAVCTETSEICVKRVRFNQVYWHYAANKLQHFCLMLKEAKRRREMGQQYHNFLGVQRLKAEPVSKVLFPGEDSIVVENLLEVNGSGQFRSSTGIWLDFNFLMGEPTPGVPSPEGYEYERILREIDSKIRNGAASDALSLR